jgi:dihydroorotase
MGLVVKNAVIVNSEKIAEQPRDILLEDGVIKKISAELNGAGHRMIDAKGKKVLPGLIDIHVHFRVPGREDKETIVTGSYAAAKGGFTTVMCMPNTSPVIDNAMIVEAIINEARRVGLVEVIPIGAITKGQKGEELTDMLELKKAGCLALSDDGKSVHNSQVMRLALEYAKMAGLLLIEHCQDPWLTSGGVMNEGFYSTLLGMKGDPGVAETVIVARDIELAHYLKTRVHLAHMSLKRSVELIRFAKVQGIAVTAEACPHHFCLTDEAVESFDASAKVNPPLRAAEDVAAVKEGLRDGTIDCIVTDHAPHTLEEKELGFDGAPPGMIGLETSFGLGMTELVHQGVLTLPQLVEKMSAAPARIVGLAGKGRIAEGYAADIAIVDPDEVWEFKKEDVVSKSKNSPFYGRRLTGRVKTTIRAGVVTYQA